MVRGLTLLLLFQFCGEFVSRMLDLPIPGNVLGMGLLLLGLMTNLVKIKWLEEAAELLLSNMALSLCASWRWCHGLRRSDCCRMVADQRRHDFEYFCRHGCHRQTCPEIRDTGAGRCGVTWLQHRYSASP